jgi:hypothetical protein
MAAIRRSWAVATAEPKWALEGKERHDMLELARTDAAARSLEWVMKRRKEQLNESAQLLASLLRVAMLA